MKKRHLKPWLQDMLIVSVAAKFLFLMMLADITVSMITFFILAYIIISMMLEVHVLSKYELRESLFFEKEHSDVC